jgi:ATP adenylyltransferase
MAWIGAATKPPGCIFCTAYSSNDDRGQMVLARTEHAFLILNAYPYASGHLMVALRRHVAAITDASLPECTDIMLLVQRGVNVLTEEYRPGGYNIGVNQGAVAGAGIADHFHMHIVPRWSGDSSFMQSIGEVRVLPEALDRTWERLQRHFGG